MIRSITSIALITSWFAIFVVLASFTQLILVPWDAAITVPEVGTWERTLNDFFASTPGYFVLSVPVLLLSIIVSRKLLRGNAIIKLVLGNFMFVPVLVIAFIVGFAVNNTVLFPYPDDVLYDPTYRGFHRSVFPVLAILFACGLWLYWQARLGSRHQELVTASE